MLGYESAGRDGCSVTTGLSSSASADASGPEGSVQAVAEPRHRLDSWYDEKAGGNYVLNWPVPSSSGYIRNLLASSSPHLDVII